MSVVGSSLPLKEKAGPAANEVLPAEKPATPILVIEARRGFRGFGFGEVWRARELLYFLVWRDVKVRYKQTVLGVGWAILQPVLTMVLFTLIFGRLGGLDRRVQAPYPVFAYAGILLWSFFASAVTQSSQSLVGSSHL